MATSIAQLGRNMATAFSADRTREGGQQLQQIMALQDLTSEPDSGSRGNFCMWDNHPAPTDLNALSFCSPYLGYAALEHQNKMEPALRERFFNRTLPECLIGFDGHYLVKSGAQSKGTPSPRWWQCNIWALNIAGRLMIARALDNSEHAAKAREQLARYRHLVENYGIAEYNSPTYLRVQLEGLHWTWYYAVDQSCREDARALLDETYRDLAEHYHAAAGVLAGTWSRHYERDFRDRGGYLSWVASTLERREPSLLEQLGLQDYVCPDEIRRIALTRRSYSVWRRSVTDARRMLYQTPEYSLATQSGEFVWKQQDTPVVVTYAADRIKRRVALIRTPYWSADRVAATDYAKPFVRWAHQYENQAILSYYHRDGGNDLLFNLATPSELKPELTDINGTELEAPQCPIMPAPPDCNLASRQPKNPLHATVSPDLTYIRPADREPPGQTVTGPILVGFPSCYLALIPGPGTTLKTALMRNDLYVVIPVRTAATLALVMAGRGQDAGMAEFAARIQAVKLEEISLPNLGEGLRLTGSGPVLTAGIGTEGRLFDRRVDERHLPQCEYLCHSPHYRRRAGEPLPQSNPNPTT